MGEVLSYNWVGTSGFQVKIKNDRFNVIYSRSRHNLKCGFFNSVVLQKTVKKFSKYVPHVQHDYLFFFLRGVALNYQTVAMDPFK